MHAEPTTFGLKLLVFHAGDARRSERLERALAEAAVGKVSGAVGTFAHLPPEVEEAGLRAPRHRLRAGGDAGGAARPPRGVVSTLALVASSLDKFAVELRHLARTEVREVRGGVRQRPEGLLRDAAQAEPLALENVSASRA